MLRHLQRITSNNDGNVHAVTSTTRSIPCSRIATPATPNGKLQVHVTIVPSDTNMSNTPYVSVLRTLSTWMSTVRPTPITSPSTMIGLQYLFVQDTVRLLALAVMTIAAMSANMRAIFTPEAMDEACWKQETATMTSFRAVHSWLQWMMNSKTMASYICAF